MRKAVFFDLDNTLYSYDKAHAWAFAAVLTYAEQALGLGQERFRALHAEANRILSQRCGGGPAIHNRLIRYQILLELAELPIAAAPEMANRYWSGLLERMEPEPGAAETLRALRSLGLRIGIGTNMTADWQFEKLKRLGLMPHVDYLVTSEEVNAEKPDPRLFALCAEKAGALPQECAFVGDSLQKDARSARAAGMLGVWYCPAGGEAPADVLTIRALPELPALLGPYKTT